MYGWIGMDMGGNAADTERRFKDSNYVEQIGLSVQAGNEQLGTINVSY